MKAQLVDSIRPGKWIYEIKFDGYRALVFRGSRQTRILSRNQNNLGKKFPEIVDSIAALDGLERKEVICTRARPNRIRIN